MIIWLASYPKSGNTFLRSLLASYFYSENGDFEFEQLKKIEQFPVNENFEKIGININDKFEVAKNYIKAQEEINKTKKLSFWKVGGHKHTQNLASWLHIKSTMLSRSEIVLVLLRNNLVGGHRIQDTTAAGEFRCLKNQCQAGALGLFGAYGLWVCSGPEVLRLKANILQAEGQGNGVLWLKSPAGKGPYCLGSHAGIIFLKNSKFAVIVMHFNG